MKSAELNWLKEEIQYINESSKRNLSYGILDPEISCTELIEFFQSANICLIYDNTNEAIGFFYNVILQIIPDVVIHAGLVLITKNKGVDLLSIPYSYLSYYQWKEFGSYYYTNISSTPSIIGTFTDLYTQVWPSDKANQLKPPKKYVEIAELVFKRYVEKYFSGKNTFDKKRFVLTSKSKEMGFETDLRKLPRYPDQNVNLFCLYWLDYAHGEDLIQVGRVGFWCALKLLILTLLKK
jgi:hypothetical protein